MKNLKKIFRRILLNFLIFLFIYTNIAVIFSPHYTPYLEKRGVPIPAVLYDTFLYSHMFISFIKVNFDHSIEGFSSVPSEPSTWIKLNVEEFFPYGVGMRHIRMTANRYHYMKGVDEQQIVIKKLADQILQRQNRLHPDRPVEKIRFGFEQWPRNPVGYRASKLPGQVLYVELYSEEEQEEQ